MNANMPSIHLVTKPVTTVSPNSSIYGSDLWLSSISACILGVSQVGEEMADLGPFASPSQPLIFSPVLGRRLHKPRFSKPNNIIRGICMCAGVTRPCFKIGIRTFWSSPWKSGTGLLTFSDRVLWVGAF